MAEVLYWKEIIDQLSLLIYQQEHQAIEDKNIEMQLGKAKQFAVLLRRPTHLWLRV